MAGGNGAKNASGNEGTSLQVIGKAIINCQPANCSSVETKQKQATITQVPLCPQTGAPTGSPSSEALPQASFWDAHCTSLLLLGQLVSGDGCQGHKGQRLPAASSLASILTLFALPFPCPKAASESQSLPLCPLLYSTLSSAAG